MQQLHLKPNGPAIWGGCVTRRSIRAPRVLGAGTLARSPERSEGSRCKEGEPAPQERSACGGALFAVRVQSFMNITSFAVQSCHGISQLSRCS
jgi:hypothetical protein